MNNDISDHNESDFLKDPEYSPLESLRYSELPRQLHARHVVWYGKSLCFLAFSVLCLKSDCGTILLYCSTSTMKAID
jgi:hypothetical protein